MTNTENANASGAFLVGQEWMDEGKYRVECDGCREWWNFTSLFVAEKARDTHNAQRHATKRAGEHA